MFQIDQLHGILPALATPLDRDGNVDEAGTHRLLDFVLGSGVHGLVALGSTGEGATLGEPHRRKFIELVAARNNNRVPLVMGVARMDLHAAKAGLSAAASVGACAALVAPPFYVGLNQEGLLDFYRRLAEDAPVPILVYNIPFLTKSSAHPATLATLAREKAIVGVKDSSGDFNYHSRVLSMAREFPSFKVFTGAESMLMSSLLMGSDGTICGSANVAPALCVELYEQVRQGNLDSARAIQFTLLDLANSMLSGLLPAGFKAGLAMLGICEAWTVAPLPGLTPAEEATVREALERCGVLAGATVPA